MARSSGTTCEKSSVTPCSTRARTVRTEALTCGGGALASAGSAEKK